MKNLTIVSNLSINKIQIYLDRSAPKFGEVEHKGRIVCEYSYNPNMWKGGTDYESTLSMAKRHLETLRTLSDKHIEQIIQDNNN